MKVLLCGATGFIGRHLARALAASGHDVVHGVRDPAAYASGHPGVNAVAIDFSRPSDAPHWAQCLEGVDVVINAVGILRETAGQRFDALHIDGPCALFDACARHDVGRVIQISALGADAGANTAYHRSKREADEHLLSLPVDGVVLQPSLVYGADGASARLFGTWAASPLIPVPGHGEQLIQPVHVDDLAEAVVRLVNRPADIAERRLAIVGSRPLTLKAYLAALRQAMGLRSGFFIHIPEALVEQVVRWASRWRSALVDTDSWRMLARGNTADAAPLTTLLGHAPMAVERFIDEGSRPLVRSQALLGWLLPMYRIGLAIVWLLSGLVSMGLFPIDQSLSMLARVGIGPAWSPWFLYGAAALDIALGVATLLWPRRRLWLAQAGLVLGYTAIITSYLPEQWLHPFGPIVKNVPFLCLLLTLYVFEERP